jgi:hypothetical protein
VSGAAAAPAEKPRWGAMPLEAFELYETRAAAVASAAGWKGRGRVVRIFPRSIRAGSAEKAVVCVVVRRRS